MIFLNIGNKVKCIHNNYGNLHLTVGKIYEIIGRQECEPFAYQIINDNNEKFYYNINRFIKADLLKNKIAKMKRLIKNDV